LTGQPVLAAEGLRVEHGRRATLDVSTLAVEAGEVLALLGPNGAGKSTLLRCLALLERPTAGVVRFHGEPLDWRSAVAYRRRTTMLFQEPLLLDTTVFENVATPLRLRGVRGPEARRRVDGWLERLGISGLARRQARSLSGGEARRVSLARALVGDPELLFLDEPFSALDAPTRVSFIGELAGLLAEQPTTTVFVTHDVGEAEALADRIAVLLGGRIQQIGPIEAVLERPADPEVESFIRSGRLPRRSAPDMSDKRAPSAGRSL